MTSLIYRNPRLGVLLVGLIIVAGVSSFVLLPRMEDPLLTERAALITVRVPGADAVRVEATVTDRIERALREIEEIKELRSTSRPGAVTLSVELRDDVYVPDPVWSRVRDKLADVSDELPDEAEAPRFEQLDVKAYALLVGLQWRAESVADRSSLSTRYALLNRLAEELEQRLKAVPGTEEVDTFGAPREEYQVELNEAQLAQLGLSVQDVARQLARSDSKVSAGLLRSGGTAMLLEVAGELDSIARIGATRIQVAPGQVVQLSDIATVVKSVSDPAGRLAFVDGGRSVVLGSLVRPDTRIDEWSADAQAVIRDFRRTLPAAITAEVFFEQDGYVAARLVSLFNNLLVGAGAVMVVILFMMGWRNALIVGLSLPLAGLMVLAGLRGLGIPMHQMSVTGLIIALGLLIDTAIVVADEVSHRMRQGSSRLTAVEDSVRHLAIPLLGSTLTTAFAFAPIALMPGPAGEFVGSIGVSVILAIFSSLLLSLTLIPALAAATRPASTGQPGSMVRQAFWVDGLHWPRFTAMTGILLQFLLARPWLAVGLSTVLPVVGFALAATMTEQFFPASDRDQVHIEVELSPLATIDGTQAVVARLDQFLDQSGKVQRTAWFLGESAPSFYYNVIPRRRHAPNYAQAIIQLERGVSPLDWINEVQSQLDGLAPEARVIVRQLEQGPPFDAPVEVRVTGADLEELRQLGDEVRRVLGQLPDVVHTQADLSDVLPKLSLGLSEQEVRRSGLSFGEIAAQLRQSTEGSLGGTILEDTEEVPVRVRVDRRASRRLAGLQSTELQPATESRLDGAGGVPLAAIADARLVSEVAAISRLNSRRINEVKAYLRAGTLPSRVVGQFKQAWAESGVSVPGGVSVEFGGEAEERDAAVGNLVASTGVLGVLLLATLVLSFSSFRLAGLVILVAGLSLGLGLLSVAAFGYPFGFMAIIGTMGLVGVAINDTIVVLAAIRGDRRAATGDVDAILQVVQQSSRHVIATTLTTVAGFAPLVLGGGGFWPPMAIAISGGIVGATVLALVFTPAMYRLLVRRVVGVRCFNRASTESGDHPPGQDKTAGHPNLAGHSSPGVPAAPPLGC